VTGAAPVVTFVVAMLVAMGAFDAIERSARASTTNVGV